MTQLAHMELEETLRILAKSLVESKDCCSGKVLMAMLTSNLFVDRNYLTWPIIATLANSNPMPLGGYLLEQQSQVLAVSVRRAPSGFDCRACLCIGKWLH